MKNTNLIFFFMLFSVILTAQRITPPDSIIIEALTDTTFAIGLVEQNRNNEKLNIKWIDQTFDSVGIANFAFERIRTNENEQWQADRIKLQATQLSSLYPVVNSILQNFTGAGYLSNAFNRYKDQYTGFYRALSPQGNILLRLTANKIAQQVNNQGQVIEDGFAGTWDIITENRFRIKDFFPANIVPDGAVFNRVDNPGDQFSSILTSVVLVKIQ